MCRDGKALRFSFLREARAKAAESVDAPVDKEAAAADVAPRHEAEAAAGPRCRARLRDRRISEFRGFNNIDIT